MPTFDDPEIKKQMLELQQRQEKYLKYRSEILPGLSQQLAEICEELDAIVKKPYRTEAEQQLMQEHLKFIVEFKEIATEMASISLERQLIQSKKFYEHVKKLAKKGDKKALEVYEDLREPVDEQFSQN